MKKKAKQVFHLKKYGENVTSRKRELVESRAAKKNRRSGIKW